MELSPSARSPFVVVMNEGAEIEETRMMPYQSYQLYQIERPKSPFEIRCADERAGRTAAAVAGVLRRLAAAGRRPQDGPCACTVQGRMATTMEVR
jgi:hypothetical protein